MNKKKVVIALLMFTLFSACGNEEIQQEEKGETKQETSAFFEEKENEEAQNEKESIITENIVRENGSIIFTTEYEIEDYCNGVFIVSKSDGLLYGVLDLNGEEILPLQYDKIKFMNKDGEHENVYIETTYEEQYAVYDAKGNKLFDEKADIISYEMEVTAENPPFFVTGRNTNYDLRNEKGELKIYREDGTQVSSIQLEYNLLPYVCWVDDNICLVGYETGDGCLECVRYISGEVVKRWEEGNYLVSSVGGMEGENYYTYVGDKNRIYNKIVITADGDLVIEEDTFTFDEMQSIATSNAMAGLSNRYQYHLGENKDCIIYQTNDTWKYEDASGNPIYEQRYYSFQIMDEGYALSNEDKQVCIITKNGRKTVDYGYLELNDSNYLFQGGTRLTRDDVFADYNTIVFNASMEENITLFGSYGMGELQKYARELELEEMLDLQPGESGMTLSGGEKNKLALLRALCRECKVLFCDEMFSALDEKSKKLLGNKLFLREDFTMVVITHDISEASLNYFDEIILMEDGKVLKQGEKSEMLPYIKEYFA